MKQFMYALKSHQKGSRNANRAVGCIQNLPSAIKAMYHLKDATLDIRTLAPEG